MTYRIHFAPPAPFVRRDVVRLFDDLFGAPAVATPTAPAVSKTETDDRLELSLDVPGIAPEAIEVTLEGRTLAIAGSRGGQQWRRTLQLPEGITAEQLTATVAHGVLTIAIPKSIAPAPQRIPVQPAAATALA